MLMPFRVLRGEVLLRAAFPQPAFNLMSDLPGLCEHLFSAFFPYGVQLGNMRIEQGTGGLGEVQFNCYLLNFGAAVRLRLDWAEVQSLDVLRVTQKQVHEISNALLSAVKQQAPGVSFQSYSVSVGYHGMAEGVLTAREFVAQFTKSPPQAPGPLLGSGAVFYYGAHGERVTSSLTIDLSAAQQDALYLKAEAVWDAAKLSIPELQGKGLEYVRSALASVGLDVGEE